MQQGVGGQVLGWDWERIIFQVQSKRRRGSMNAEATHNQNVVYVEYCRSCQTHSWCTHHQQAKYHDTFLKLSEMITQRHPNLEVIGNMIPSNLIPFKISENKYIDSNTNKYVVYPQIGSFEVSFNHTTIFSKKQTSGWPNLSSILNKISATIDPNFQSPRKKEQNSQSPKKSQENTPSKTIKNNQFLKSNDEQKTHYKDQTKGFTLTDHFKMYRPKHKMEDKDWLTEKQDSQGSAKQISEFGRGESREKSQRSDQFSNLMRQHSGDSKLKEMLKNRGLMLKDHGKKEMIIKLDSIEEENAYEDNGITQRTTQKSSKKKRMEELENAFSTLENKFKRFETKVKDIQSQNEDFEYQKDQEIGANSRLRQKATEKKEEQLKKSNIKQLPPFDKQVLYMNRPSKLELYLNASEQEKNEKLHRIYGEWKLLKQTANKNNRLLKNRKKGTEEPSSDDEETSQANSQSPSSNIITFKPKVQNSLQNKITSVLNNKIGHKFSNIQRYQESNSQLNHVSSEPKFKTDQHFYNRKYFRKEKIDSEKDRQTQPTTKILKNRANNMSMEAFRAGSRQSSSKKGGNQTNSGNFGQSAQKNIDRIHQRISRIQEQLNKQKEKQYYIEHPHEIQPEFYNPYNKYSKSKSRSQSGGSSDVSEGIKFGNQSKENSKKEVRNSHRLSKVSTLKKKGSKTGLIKKGAKFAEQNTKCYKTGHHQPATIEEESQLLDSNVVTQRSQDKVIDDYSSPKGTKRATKKETTLQTQKSKKHQKENGIPQHFQQSGSPGHRLNRKEEESVSENQDQTENKHSESHRQSRIKQHDLHDPQTFLRRQKQWKESQPKTSKRKEPKHISQHAEVEISEINAVSKFRMSQNKQTFIKPVKVGKAKLNTLQNPGVTQTPKKKGTKFNDSTMTKGSPFSQGEKVSVGRIKKNKKKDQTLFKKNSSSSNEFTPQDPCHDNENPLQNEDEYESTSQPHTPDVIQRESGREQSDGMIQDAPTKLTHSNSGRIIKNNARLLQYYKSQDIVFEGRKGYSNSISGSANEEDTKEEKQQIQYLRTKGEARKDVSENDVNDRVEGWGVNSQEEVDLEAEEDEEVEIHSQNETNTPNRRNSLDNQLEELGNEDNIEALHQQYKTEFEEEEKGEEVIFQHEETKVNADIEGTSIQHQDQPLPAKEKSSSIADQHSRKQQLPEEERQHSQIIEKQNQERKDGMEKKTKKEKKEKKGKKEKKRKQEKKEKKQKLLEPASQVNQIDSQNLPEQDLQKMLASQYSNYLSLKISSDLSKPQVPEVVSEMNEYEDGQFKVNVLYCASVDSIPAEEEPCPTDFMKYDPPIEAKQEVIDEEQHSEEDEIDQQEQNSDEDYNEQSEEQRSEYSQEDECQLEQSQKNSCEEGMVIAEPTVTIPKEETANAQPTITTSNPVSSPKQQKLVSSSKAAEDPVTQDNVYCQPREVSKRKSYGVQKEATNEVSIQTDQPDAVLISKNMTRRAETPTKQDVPLGLQSQTSRSDFNSTIRNNFLSENKRATLQRKKKKEIERAHIIEKIYSKDVREQIERFGSVMKGNDDELVKEQGLVLRLEQVYPNGTLIGQKGLGLDMLMTKFTNLLKVVEILCEKSQWLISRLFEDKLGLLKNRAFGLWVCQHYQWRCIVMDDYVAVDEQNEPLRSKHHGNQMWFNVLEKGLAVALGGYEQLAKAESSLLFTMLTGCNAISARVKQDPTKNTKLLYLITDCLRKNYIIHAHKNFDKSKREGREAIYYICSVRRSGEDQTLVELSQDGKESFWVKLSKFAEEFNKIDILHLRINHNFAHLDLGVGRPGQLTVIELDFFQEGQGCVTLNYLGEVGSLKAFLYREQKNKVLKLVGQAKEKLKSHLFFQCNFSEGRYFVFVQTEQKPSRISYLGEGQPTIRVTEEIHSEGLNNDMAEYLPVKESEENRLKRSELDSLANWRERRGPSKLRDNFMESRLKETFVDLVLGRSRRS